MIEFLFGLTIGSLAATVTAFYFWVSSLDKMARKLAIPRVPTPMWVYLVWIGFCGLAAFTGVSLHRRGASGWAWLFWGVIFTIVGFFLMNALKSNSGGSFGGGSSGGGGASGSW